MSALISQSCSERVPVAVSMNRFRFESLELNQCSVDELSFVPTDYAHISFGSALPGHY